MSGEAGAARLTTHYTLSRAHFGPKLPGYRGSLIKARERRGPEVLNLPLVNYSAVTLTTRFQYQRGLF